MWKRDEAPKPVQAEGTAVATAVPNEGPNQSRRFSDASVNIGKSVVIKGELNGSEDLIIDGHVEGTIQLRSHALTIGRNGRIKANVYARAVIVLGQVTGNVTASERVEIRDEGTLDGDIVSPRVSIAEGAHFRGSVDMQRIPPVPAEVWRVPVEVVVPDRDANAAKNVAALRDAAVKLLEAFDFSSEKDMADLAQAVIPRDSSREIGLHHGR